MSDENRIGPPVSLAIATPEQMLGLTAPVVVLKVGEVMTGLPPDDAEKLGAALVAIAERVRALTVERAREASCP